MPLTCAHNNDCECENFRDPAESMFKTSSVIYEHRNITLYIFPWNKVFFSISMTFSHLTVAIITKYHQICTVLNFP